MLKQHHFHSRMFATNAPQTTTHKILHTNDIHGRLAEEKGRVIGMAKLKQ